MVQTLAKDYSSYASVMKWASEFKPTRDSTGGDSRLGLAKITITDEQVDVVYRMALDDRRLTIQQIAKSIGISSSGSVHTVLTEVLGMCKLSTR